MYIIMSVCVSDATEHRNMPLESAVTLIMGNYEQWLASNGDAPSSTGRSAPTSGFKPPDDNIARMLQMVLDGRCLVVEELDEVIGYFEQQKNAMAKSQGIAATSKPPPPG